MCGILQWHQKGYTGKNIKICELESCPILPMFDGKLHDSFGYGINQSLISFKRVVCNYSFLSVYF